MRIRLLAGSLAAAAVLATSYATGAVAQVVPIYPGDIAAGRPIVGTTQNLPPLKATHTYDAGPNFASDIVAYWTSGAYGRDQQEIAAAAEKWVRTYVARSCKAGVKACKAMVVFDIDDTLHSNYQLLAGEDEPFTYQQDVWDEAVEGCTMPLITPVADFYHAVQKLGVKTAIVTGRGQSTRDETVSCLRKQGITGWYELVTRTPATDGTSAAVFKSQQRAAWEDQGYTIVASIGDQVSDMALGHVLKGFLLPNPMYMIP